MARTTSALLLALATTTAVTAQQCRSNGASCVPGNDALILYCENATWATHSCKPNEYCMTMGPAMTHCMLRPEGMDSPKTSAGASSSSATSTQDGHDSHGSPTATPTPTSSGTHDSDSSKSPSSSTDTGSGAAGIKPAAGVVAAGLGLAGIMAAGLF